jgi:DNA-binding CsgD family transcriptional regulator
VVDDQSVSRQHAELRLSRAALQISDLKSRNGTFLANERIQSSLARPGQVVRFGDISFIVTVLDELSDEETNAPSDRCGMILSDAQRRVFQLLLEGLPEKKIANRLVLSQHTIHNHTRAIFRIFGVHSRTQLVVAIRQKDQALHTKWRKKPS